MGGNRSVSLQDVFLNQVRKDRIAVTIHLVNGYQFRGFIKAFDNFVVIVDIEGKQQMIYKHALSTITPARPVSFMPPANAESGAGASEE